MPNAFRTSNQLKGILCIVASGAIFAFTDAIAKLLTGEYPPGQILFFRSVFVFISIAAMTWWKGGLRDIRIVDWRRQIARGLIVATTSFIFIVALKHVPLADMTALMFLSPLVLTAMAPYFLKERVGWRRWTAVVIGFCGTLLIIRPSGDVPLWPLLLAASITVLIAFRDILTRRLSATDTANGMMICSTAIVTILGACLLPFGWVTPDWQGLTLFALAGGLQGVAQYFLVYAFIYGEAVMVTPFRYFLLIWATLYGYLLFGTIPSLQTLAGASIVVASGLFVFYRDIKLKK